jgi:4-hydroxyacetophenone monooxygenase
MADGDSVTLRNTTDPDQTNGQTHDQTNDKTNGQTKNNDNPCDVKTIGRERWAEAINIANIPTLLMVLVQMTGDRKWLQPPFTPTRGVGLSDNDTAGLAIEQQCEVRDAATGAIMRWANGEPLAIERPSPEMLVEMMSVSLGEVIPAEYASMIETELRGTVSTRPTPNSTKAASRQHATSNAEPFDVLIIGAGASGIGAAVQLANAGIRYSIVEKYHEVGGTWLENRYPGCGVDVPSHLYAYSWAPNNWTHYFALRDELQAYFARVATEFGVRDHIRFSTEMKRMTWRAEVQKWEVELRTPEGEETVYANVVITAVGAFNKPRIPNLPGRETFNGPQAHTARWPGDGIDLKNKRVAVIGTGASAMQVVPQIAPDAASVFVFQRSPHWATPFEKFRVKVPEPITFLLNAVPLYHDWYRIRLSWAFNDRIHDALQRDPHWSDPARSVNAKNDGFRRALTRYIEAELGDRRDLMDKVVPDYPPFGKRILLDNRWYQTLCRENVSLFTEAVNEVLPTAVISDSGETHDVDVIIWATGFDVVHFLAPLEIIGRSGRTLHDTWNGDDARAFLGTAVPDFPNLFCLYGPNTQFGHGGSLTSVVERQMHYVLDLLVQMRANALTSVEVRADVHDAYNARIDDAHSRMVWTHPGMDTYYRNSRGRVPVNNPFRIVDMWNWTESASLHDYITHPSRTKSVNVQIDSKNAVASHG